MHSKMAGMSAGFKFVLFLFLTASIHTRTSTAQTTTNIPTSMTLGASTGSPSTAVATTVAESTTTDITSSAAATTTTAGTSMTVTTAPRTANPVNPVNATAAPTAAPTTSTAVTVYEVVFTDPDATFTADLADSTSQAFMDRATLTTSQIDPLYASTFPDTFLNSEVASFASGSVISTLLTRFRSANAPNQSAVGFALASFAQNVTGFTIDGTSIIVNGTTSSSPSIQGQTMSLVPALCLVLGSWLLTSQR